MHAYGIAHRQRQNYSSVQNALVWLSKHNLVRLSRRPKSRRGNKRTKLYTLTPLGVWSILGEASPKTIRRTVAHYSHVLPLVLGKWDIFVHCEVEDLAMRLLRSVDLANGQRPLVTPDPSHMTSKDWDKAIANRASFEFYLAKDWPTIFSPSERTRWDQVYQHSGMREIEELLIQGFKELEAWHRLNLTRYQLNREIIERDRRGASIPSWMLEAWMEIGKRVTYISPPIISNMSYSKFKEYD
jgi:hypothetical protein